MDERTVIRAKDWFTDSGAFVYSVRKRRCIPRDYLVRFYARTRHRHRITSKPVPTFSGGGRVVPLVFD